MESFQCPLCCGRIFNSRKALKYHLLSEVENVSCPKCKHQFDTIQELTTHLDVPCIGLGDTIAGRPKPWHRPTLQEGLVSTEETVQNASQVSDNEDIDRSAADNASNIDDLESVLLPSEVCVTSEDSPMPEAKSAADDLWTNSTARTATHYCSTCNLQIYDLMEHINTFHPHDTIYYEDEGGPKVESESCEYGREMGHEVTGEYMVEVGTSEASQEGILNTKHCKPDIQNTNNMAAVGHEYALLNTPESNLARSKKSGIFLNKGVKKHNFDIRTSMINGKSTLKRDGTTFSTSTVIKTEPDCDEDSSSFISKSFPSIKSKIKVNFDNGQKLLPKELGLVRKYQMVDNKTGIPYTRKVIQIEKFWEKEAFKTVQSELLKTAAAKEFSKPRPIKKRINASRKKPFDKEQSNVVNVESHLEDLFRSGALISVEHTMRNDAINQHKQNKKYVLKDGAFVEEESEKLDSEMQEESEYAEAHSSVTTIENVKVNFNEVSTDTTEGRTSILKFIQDDAGENMIPIYTCSKCNKEYSSTRSFKSHKCKIPRVYVSVLCSVCGYKCKNKTNLEKHMIVHDPEYIQELLTKKVSKRAKTVPVTCDVCSTEFRTENGLRMHKKMHRPDNLRKVAEMNNKVEYVCDHCNLVCYSERTFRIHYKIHLPDENEVNENATRPFHKKDFGSGLLTCKTCLEDFASNDDLRAHWVTHHASEKNPGDRSAEFAAPADMSAETVDASDTEDTFTCTVCSKELSVGVREQHATINCGQYKYTCATGTCNRHFKSEEELAMHSQCHAAESDFTCAHCNMTFGDASALRAHVARHSTQVERPYPCGFCGRRFARPHEKVKHEWVHTGYQPYVCKVCGMRFRVAYCLKTHERIHTGVRPYTCDQCGKQFRTCSGHRAHIRIHSDVRSYKCKLCCKTFKTPIQLAGHRKSHTKPYTCTLCSRRFANMFMLRAHTARHTTHKESLRHKCHICGASYGREYALKDHIKTHGKNIPPTPDEEVVEYEEEVSQQSSGTIASNDS